MSFSKLISSRFQSVVKGFDGSSPFGASGSASPKKGLGHSQCALSSRRPWQSGSQ